MIRSGFLKQWWLFCLYSGDCFIQQENKSTNDTISKFFTSNIDPKSTLKKFNKNRNKTPVWLVRTPVWPIFKLVCQVLYRGQVLWSVRTLPFSVRASILCQIFSHGFKLFEDRNLLGNVCVGTHLVWTVSKVESLCRIIIWIWTIAARIRNLYTPQSVPYGWEMGMVFIFLKKIAIWLEERIIAEHHSTYLCRAYESFD